MNRLTVEEFRASKKLPLTVVLDNVRSLNNIGSVFRTSDAFRVEHIALCGITATPPHREIHKTALGAEESMEWSYYEDASECIRELKAQGYKIFAVEQVSDSIKLGIGNWALEKGQDKVAIVFGNEIEGVQESLLPLCDGALEIPQFGTKHSLNVSCAAAIVIWEMHKQLSIKIMNKEEKMQKARQLHRSGCNCCQAVVMAYADKLPIDKENAMGVAAPFGRGLAGTREVCGCVSGMAMVCGLMGHSDDVRTLIERFREMEGDIVCGRLLSQGKKPCPEMVADAAGLLAENIES